MSDSAPAAASVSEPTAAPAEPVPAPAPVDRRPRQQWKGRDAGPDDNELLLINYVKRATRKNLWYYRDRCGVARGPATLPTLREAWVHGLIDENTLCHGQGLVDFLPIKNIRTLTPQIRTWDVRAATWLKKHLALKPALNQARKERAEFRDLNEFKSTQVDRMY